MLLSLHLMSRQSINWSELKHSAIEKEAAAIIKAVWKWKHYLTGQRLSGSLIKNLSVISLTPSTVEKLKTIKSFAGESNLALTTLILFTDLVKKTFPQCFIMTKLCNNELKETTRFA